MKYHHGYLLAVAIFSSCAVPSGTPSSGSNVLFRYTNKIAVGGDSVLLPVSVKGTNDGLEHGGNNDPDGSTQFDVQIANASTVVTSPDGNSMSNPDVMEAGGALRLTWDEIDDYHTGVLLRYKNGSISQSKLK